MGAVLRWVVASLRPPKAGPIRTAISTAGSRFRCGSAAEAMAPHADRLCFVPQWRRCCLYLAMMDLMPRLTQDPIEDRLIVALDLPTVAAARAMTERLDGVVSFFKLGLWLIFAPGFDRLLEDLIAQGKKVFLDAKMFDIGETVKQGVGRAAERGASFVTVQGDRDIIAAAVQGKRGSDLRILAITVLTSIDDAGARDLGHRLPVAELIRSRVAICTELGVDGVIASPHDIGDIRRVPGADALLVVTPGVRLP